MGSNGLPVWLGNRLKCLLVLDDPVSPSSLADPFTRQCSFVIVASSKTFVCSSVRSLLIFHMLKGKGNVPAHLLAQHALHVKDFHAWLEECPSPIVHTCAHNVLCSN